MPDRPTPEVAEAAEKEMGEKASQTRRGAPVWLTPVLIALAAFGIVWLILLPAATWADWTVLAAIVVVTVGLFVAINPRRSSAPGGTQRH